MYKYDKDKLKNSISLDKMLIDKRYTSPYELFQFDKETIYIIPTPPPFKPVKFVFVGDKNV